MCSYRIPVQDPPDIAPNRWCLRALGGLAGAQLAHGGSVGSVDNSNHPDHILISGVSRAALHGSLGLLRLPTRPSQVKNANLKLLPRGICPKEASTVLEKAPWNHVCLDIFLYIHIMQTFHRTGGALRGLAGAQLAHGSRAGSMDTSNHPDYILISGVSRAALHERQLLCIVWL